MNTLSLPNKKRGRTGSNIKFADDLQDLQELEPYLCKAAFKKEPGKRKPVESLVKEKAVMIARLKAAERSEAELEFLQREVGQAKAALERKDAQLMKLKARLYDIEHPEEA